MVMRKLLFLVMLIVAIVAAASAVPASASTGPAEVTGIGMLGQFGDPAVDVTAVQTVAGPIGQFGIVYPDGTFAYGLATCLFVAGTTAYLTGRVVSSGGPGRAANNWFPGRYIIIGIKDNGPPGTATPDLMNFSPAFAANPGCGPNGQATPVFPIVRGDYQVSGSS